MEPTLTILAPTHDRPGVLELVWRSWVCQAGVREIVVVNDGSKQNYESVFASISEACKANGITFLPIRLESRVGAPAAKNIGLAHCTSDEILTTDDDIILDPEMVRDCRRQRFGASETTIVGPRVIYLKDGDSKEMAVARSIADRRPYFDYKRLTLVPWVDLPQPQETPFVTAVAIWPRALFQAGLRFYEGYGGNGYREETDPQLEAQANFGAKVLFTPLGKCFHLAPSIAYAAQSGQRRGGVLWYEYWVTRNNFIFLRRHGKLLYRRFNIHPIACFLQLLIARFSPARALKLLKLAK